MYSSTEITSQLSDLLDELMTHKGYGGSSEAYDRLANRALGLLEHLEALKPAYSQKRAYERAYELAEAVRAVVEE